MKKEIKVSVHACDKCKRHDMELITCIGCGISLCSFCSGDRSEKYSMATQNKYGCGCNGFRKFIDFKFDREELYFCITCMTDPAKHEVAQLLVLCIKKEKGSNKIDEINREYRRTRAGELDKAWSLIHDQETKLREKGVYFPYEDYEEVKE